VDTIDSAVSNTEVKGKEQKRINRKKKSRIAQTVYRTGKLDFCRIMVDLGMVSTLKEASRAYDAVTAGINAMAPGHVERTTQRASRQATP